MSGDARRALDICRRAMEIAESRDAETISLKDVTEAVSEMIASAKVQAIKHCSKMEQTFLQAVSAEVTRTSIEEVYFKDAYRQLESLCSFNGSFFVYYLPVFLSLLLRIPFTFPLIQA